MTSASAMTMFLMSKLNGGSSWTHLLWALVWETRFKEQLLMTKGFRGFVRMKIGVVTPEELRSAKCDLTRLLQSQCFGVHLRDCDGGRSMPMAVCLMVRNLKLSDDVSRVCSKPTYSV